MNTRRKIAAIGVAAGVICVTALLFRNGTLNLGGNAIESPAVTSQSGGRDLSIGIETKSNPTSGFAVISDELTSTGRLVTAAKDGITNQMLLPERLQVSETELEEMLFSALDQAPLQPQPTSQGLNRHLFFYGLVVDDKTNSLTGASVEAVITLIEPNQPRVEKVIQTQTGMDGRFFIDAEWGQKLRLRVTKQGYMPSQWQDFLYARLSLGSLHQPDISQPVLFVLGREGELEQLLYFERRFRAPNTGDLVRVDLTTGRLVQSGGDLVVSIRCPEPYTELRPFPWALSVHAVDGGLVQVNALQLAQLHEAPHDGYTSGFEIAYDEVSNPFRVQHEGVYFLRSQGGRVYAKLRFNMNTFWDERGVPFGIEAYVNTNASRNLRQR